MVANRGLACGACHVAKNTLKLPCSATGLQLDCGTCEALRSAVYSTGSQGLALYMIHAWLDLKLCGETLLLVLTGWDLDTRMQASMHAAPGAGLG